MDAAAPGLLLAQGIGRIGNWWNQELYGKPTDLPWGLEIDPLHQAGIPAQVPRRATAYHPTFLYELIWDLAGVALLLWLDRRYTFRPPGAVRALRRRTTASAASSRSSCGSTRRTTSPGCGSTRGSRSSLFVGSTAFFIWWQLLGAAARGATAAEGEAAAAARPGAAEDGRPQRPRPVAGLACRG